MILAQTEVVVVVVVIVVVVVVVIVVVVVVVVVIVAAVHLFVNILHNFMLYSERSVARLPVILYRLK